jgi:hypothetical protein
MTPLQILCSFQSWNAKTIDDDLHDQMEELIQVTNSLSKTEISSLRKYFKK